MARIMTNQHPDWDFFFLQLVTSLDFRNEYRNGRPTVVDDCTHTFKHTIRILTKMGGVNIPASLDKFRELGAKCDCGVVMIPWEVVRKRAE